MKSFLESVAEAYLLNEDPRKLHRYCFVFPNKRTGAFFHNIVADAMYNGKYGEARGGLHPASTTIADLINDLSDTIQADRIEALFILYDAYVKAVADYRREVLGKPGSNGNQGAGDVLNIDFNKFLRWADVLLADINDVDMALAPVDQIFLNVREFREISTNPLTAEQLKALANYWNKHDLPQEARDFWNHIATSIGRGPEHSVQFIRLWQVMKGIYDNFRTSLAEKGLHYSGMAYRQVVENFDSLAENGRFHFERYVFVGFGLLNKAEKRFFTLMKNLRDSDGNPMADFYWDNSSAAFHFKEKNQSGSTEADTDFNPGIFINGLAEEFPSLYPCVTPNDRFPRINIIGVPSRIGQAKFAGQIVDEELINRSYPEGSFGALSEEEKSERLRKIGIILPDESLALPVLRSIPDEVKPVNITMGYRLKQASAANFISTVVTMQLRGHSTGQGSSNVFLTEDVLRVLSHPIVNQAEPAASLSAIVKIRLKRSIVIAEQYLQTIAPSQMSGIFTLVKKQDDPDSVLSYLETVAQWTENALNRIVNDEVPADSTQPEETPAPKESGKLKIVDLAVIQRYRQAVSRIKRIASQYLRKGEKSVADYTVFHLVDRLIAGETLSFQGQPLRGIQLMGILEARVIDFDELIIPSMNAKIFPKKHYNNSLIPPILRHAYGLFTVEQQEQQYAYFFYRMIGRANRVWLLYDARADKGGAESQYIFQLKYLYNPEGMREYVHGYDVKTSEIIPTTIRKSDEIMEKIEAYFTPGSGRYLSASSINEYINCSLQFYLKNIEGYNREDEINEWVDESTYGTVVHEVMQWIYETMSGRNPEKVITKADIEAWINEETTDDPRTGVRKDTRIFTLISQSLAKNYLFEKVAPLLEGSNLLVANMIDKYVVKVLKCDAQIAPFRFIGGEIKIQKSMTLPDSGNPEGLTFNLKGSIDRVDCVDSRLRIIDYKTGSDPIAFKTPAELFDNNIQHRPKAILQLMLYSLAYDTPENNPSGMPVQPMIYKLKTIFTEGLKPLSYGVISETKSGKLTTKYLPLSDYRQYPDAPVTNGENYLDEIESRLCGILKELKNREIPFETTKSPYSCKYCNFIDICRKKI